MIWHCAAMSAGGNDLVDFPGAVVQRIQFAVHTLCEGRDTERGIVEFIRCNTLRAGRQYTPYATGAEIAEYVVSLQIGNCGGTIYVAAGY